MLHKLNDSNLGTQNIENNKIGQENQIQNQIKTTITNNTNNNKVEIQQENNNNNTKDVINEITKLLNNTSEFKNNNISFDYDSEAEIFYVKLTDSNKTEVIQQYPTKDFIEKLKSYREQNKQDLNIFLDVKS